MKNLHKKIGVILLSGLVLAGGGLAVSSSVAHASGLDFQAEVDLNSLKAYGEKAGFKVRLYNNEEVKNLDGENSNPFGSAYEVCDYIYGNQEELKKGLYKANIDSVEFIIEVGKGGIQDVAPEDVF